jgi:hypothetical protein
MGMIQNTNTNAINYRFSSFLGTTYLSNEETEKVVSEAKAFVGESEVKKGFTGTKGDSATAKAMRYINGKVPYGPINGYLKYCKVREVEVSGQKIPYLTLGLSDSEGMHFISASLQNDAVQMMVRKLSLATPGKFTELKYFSMLDKPNEKGDVYSSDACYLRQSSTEKAPMTNEDEVKGISYAEGPKPVVDAAASAIETALKDAPEDIRKKAISDTKSSARLKYHLELMVNISAMFAESANHEEKEAEMADDCPF